MFLDNLYKSVERNSNKNAFFIKEKFYTYSFLSEKASQIQTYLIKRESKELNEKIAIICSDDILTYSAIIGIWFLGKSYIPLGELNPHGRNLTILREAGISTIFTTDPLNKQIYKEFNVIDLNELLSTETALLEYFSFDIKKLAYTIFTSGSTGTPKGVPISFENLNSFINAFKNSPVIIGPDDRCLQMFELTFDVSISSFLPALISGACIYTVPNNVIKYVHVLKLMTTHKLTVVQIVPSVIQLAKSLLPKLNLHFVKYCILTGEATSLDSFELLKKCLSSAKIYNYYGPTESTIYCSYFDCNKSLKSYNGMIAIGRPFKDISMIIVDELLNEVEIGVKGEMLLAGTQLTTGYLNNPDKSSTSFVSLKCDGNNVRYYKTGDICFKDEQGDIYYCGRLDSQVKIQGFRIEMSEIEICVRNISKLNSIVVPKVNKMGALELALVLEAEKNYDIKFLKDKLKEKLPEYMVPNLIYLVEELPLNSSGKLDRMKIKAMING